MPAIEALCNRAIFMEGGRIKASGTCSDVITTYMQGLASQTRTSLQSGTTRHIRSFVLRCSGGEPKDSFRIGEDIIFDTELYSDRSIDHPRYAIGIHTPRGERIATLHTGVQQNANWELCGAKRLRVVWQRVPLNVGMYRVDILLWDRFQELETLVDCKTLEILPRDIYQTGVLPDTSYHGYLIPEAKWEMEVDQKIDH
jgi:hypothetical protein